MYDKMSDTVQDYFVDSCYVQTCHSMNALTKWVLLQIKGNLGNKIQGTILVPRCYQHL
jgi:hypothetical protein